MSGCKTCETTNQAVDRVCESLRELIDWADADEQHARENHASDTARDDHRRGTNLRKALNLLLDCKR